MRSRTSSDFSTGSRPARNGRRQSGETLCAAYESGAIYVTPNSFTYSTHGNRRSLDWSSLPQRDDELRISLDDRGFLSECMPETLVLRLEIVDRAAREKSDFVLKPAHGFAGRDLLVSDAVGRERLRRLSSHGPVYVAQRRIPKSPLEVGEATLRHARFRPRVAKA
ncbi:MAG TPA: hypothetical protein VIG36_10380 [Methylocystis sp.]|jgi:hypothetical protein